MSDDFLARWSRRKRDVAEAEQAKSSALEGIVRDGSPIEAAETVEPAAPPEPMFDLKDLPPIDSITAATDIRPFLAPGVPVDIARAALRRAWSADPRIRDFVGLADYDWDYHAVGGAGGFGPLEMTDELRRAVARILGETADVKSPDKAGDPAVGADAPRESRVLSVEADVLPTGLSHGPDGHPQAVCVDARNQAEPSAVVEPAAQVFAATQHPVREGQDHRPMSRRTHGRALPK